MAILISLLPGMGGQVGSVVADAIQLVENSVQCVATEGGDLEACFQAILVAFQLVWDAFQALFPTRPKVGKDSASDDTALFFISSENPVIALWGAGIRNAESNGWPTSASGGPGYAYNLKLASAVLADLQTQFDGVNAGKVTYGGLPVTGANLFALYHQLGFNANHPDSNAMAIQQRITLDNLYNSLVDQGGIDPKTGFPPKQPPPPKCPPGQHWDGTKCVPDTTSTLPPGDPDQDEFQDCCDETLAALAGIQSAIKNAGAGGTPTDCCTTIANALSGLGVQLTGMASALLNLGGIQTDMGGVISGLNRIGDALAKLNTGIPQPLHVHIDNPPSPVTVNVPPPDLTKVVEQLVKLVDEGDVQQTVLNYLTTNGFMTGADAQVIQGARWSDAIVGIFRTYGWRAIEWFHNYIGITWNGAGFTIDFAKFTQTLPEIFSSTVNALLAGGAAPLYPEIKGIIDGVVQQLRPVGAVTPGNSGVDGDLLVAKTLAPALIINAASWLAGYLGWEVSEQLKEYVEIATTLTGFEEVREVKLGQLMQAGPIAAARLQAQRTYRQNIPGTGEAASWNARRIAPGADAHAIMAFNGLHDQYHNHILTAAYSGMSARQLIRLSATGLFSAGDIQDELNFDGMRPASQHRYQLALPYLATDPERRQLRSQLESEYEAGLLSLDELIQQIDSADHLLDRDKLIVNRVNSKLAMEIATALEREYSTMYQAGLIDHATYAANLSGMGLQQWKVDTLVGIGDARRAATLQRQMLADERALVRATAAKERQTAMLGYSTGTLSAPALLAALVATGLTAQQAGAWTAIAALKKEGNLRWIYGLEMQPAQATLLKERVSALTTQIEKGYITPIEYVNALNALHIPAHWVNGLLAKAEATIAKTKGGALVQVNLQ